MGKSVIDLSADELGELAREAWSGAAREALVKGLSITGSHDGRRYRYHPDGRIDDLGPVALPQAASVEPNVEAQVPRRARRGRRSPPKPKRLRRSRQRATLPGLGSRLERE